MKSSSLPTLRAKQNIGLAGFNLMFMGIGGVTLQYLQWSWTLASGGIGLLLIISSLVLVVRERLNPKLENRSGPDNLGRFILSPQFLLLLLGGAILVTSHVVDRALG